MDYEPLKLTCIWCGAVYTGRPSEHICPDGKTFKDRISKTGEVPKSKYLATWEQEAEIRRFENKLTDDDKKFLRGLKIKVY